MDEPIYNEADWPRFPPDPEPRPQAIAGLDILQAFTDRFSLTEGLRQDLAELDSEAHRVEGGELALASISHVVDAISPSKAASASRSCETCGAQVSEGAKFCGHCGSTLRPRSAEPVQPHCPGCGRPHSGTVRFCGHCGTELSPPSP